MTDLEEFHRQFRSEMLGNADADGVYVADAFFDRVSELLQEAGETESGNRSYYKGRFEKKNLLVDGYGGDPRDADGVLTLLVCEYAPRQELRSIAASEVKPLFARLVDFLRAARVREFRESLDESSQGFALADLIATTWDSITKIKLILLTNADCRAKVDAFTAGSIDDKTVSYSIWDIKRIRKFVEQGLAREELTIDFTKDYGGSVPLLRASGSEAALESYLAVIRGSQLAAIYDKWGARLLEANVRAFLQAKGGVNQGIRHTILNEPHMFLSYNNGIAATADSVEVRQGETGLELVAAHNLQIVNGGQTTASIHAARKAAGDKLDDLFVQMKISVVPRARFEEVVPRISEYANSQNKVNSADFFANHPFHIKMQEMSRRVLAPSGDNGYRETKWFYERARGQYADERAKLSEAQRKHFDATYPRSQFFTKTDLAKYENSYIGRPHLVSLGAQKNFGDFAKSMEARWGADGAAIDDTWFRRMIAKALIFRALEPLVSSAPWYEGGYRANIVTYGIAKLVHDIEARGKVIDLDRIWRAQAVPEALGSALLVAAAEAQSIILSPTGSVRNLGEWAKKPACWKLLCERVLDYGYGLDDIVVDRADMRQRDAQVQAAAGQDVEIAAQTQAVELGARVWVEALTFGKSKRALSEEQATAIAICAGFPAKLPTGRQAVVAVRALEKLRGLGLGQGG